ncbi:hypothetical protein HDU79_010898 [Rhizoclosmatium sp. JEL0117]|nr:hypothetical protein HDU79_010898 [Rhizoclosmatium sp. JEL0117]
MLQDSRRRHTISQQGLQNLIAASKTRSTGSSKYVPDSRVYATPQAPLQIGQSPSSSSRLLSATQGLNGPTANRLSCDECNKHVLPALLTIVGSFRYCDACKPAANCENCSQPASETYDQARLCRGCFIRASRSGVGSNGPQTTHQNIPNMMNQRFHEQERLRNQALSDFNGVRSSAVPAATVSRMLRYTFEIVAYKAVKSKSTNGFVNTPLLAKTADGSTFVLERYLPGTFCKFYANYGFTPINTGDEFDSLNLFFECIMHLSLKDSDGMAILVDIQGTVTQMEKSKSICLTDFQVVTNPAIVSENQFL